MVTAGFELAIVKDYYDFKSYTLEFTALIFPMETDSVLI
jgi:hypothetical protein